MPAQDNQSLSMALADWTLLIVLSVLWGGSFFFAKIVLFELPPLTVALGRVATALGYLIYFRILARAGATNVLLVTFLIPVSAILLGTLFLGEALEARHIAGMIAIAVGLAAIDGRPAVAVARAVRRRKH